jgi:hypothetical protein
MGVRGMKQLFLAAIAVIIPLAAAITAPASHAAPTPRIIFDSRQNACTPQDFPDQPARAFRDETGTVHLLDSQYNATANLGPTLLATTHNCAIVLHSDFVKSPAAFDDYEWPTSLYTADGKNIIALVHEEFQGAEQPKLCPSKNPSGCTQTAIIEAFSHDSGNHFTRTPGAAGLVATLPYRYRADQNLWYGFMNPTNTVTYQNAAYFMATFVTPQTLRHPRQIGVCLLRSKTPSNPHSWRAWNGKSFSIAFPDPYTQPAQSAPPLPCQPIGTQTPSLGSLSWYLPGKFFVLLTRCQLWNKTCAPGAYIATSTDLIHWSKSIPLLLDSEATPTHTSELYPALLDPAAPDRNFVDITASPWLFTTEIINRYRLLLAFPVHLSQLLKTANAK